MVAFAFATCYDDTNKLIKVREPEKTAIQTPGMFMPKSIVRVFSFFYVFETDY